MGICKVPSTKHGIQDGNWKKQDPIHYWRLLHIPIYWNLNVPIQIHINGNVIGTSLSEPHTSVTALQDLCLCMYVCGHIPKIFIERTETKAFQLCTHALQIQIFNGQCQLTWWTPHYPTPHRWIYWVQQRTPHRVTQHRWIYWVWERDCIWSERKGLLLDCSVGAKEIRSEDDQRRLR